MLVGFVNRACNAMRFFIAIGAVVLFAGASNNPAHAGQSDTESVAIIALGKRVFFDNSLSVDQKTSCSSCHDPAHAYADARAKSIGAKGAAGTRNAPSLLGIAHDDMFFWDGRRSRLADVVLDPFTNPVELGLSSRTEVISRLGRDPGYVEVFRAAFPGETILPNIDQVSRALTAFIASIPSGTSEYDRGAQGQALRGEAEHGRQLFVGSAGCGECHIPKMRFADGKFHYAGIGEATRAPHLAETARAVVEQRLGIGELGPKILTDMAWSSLGRFVVTRDPADIGAFHTPSLRNVAATAPYMHDGSIATLREAVDHEIYYRGASTGRPIVLSATERHALVSFLQTLTDSEAAAR